jgi:hypothetical protein
VPNLFCGLCRKGSGFDFAVRYFVSPPFAQLHPRNVLALAVNFTLIAAMHVYLIPKMGILPLAE